MGERCINDEVLSSCIEKVPGLIPFISKVSQSTAVLLIGGTSTTPRHLWSHGACRGISQVCMQLALSLDSLVYDLAALSSTDHSVDEKAPTELSDFISVEIRIIQLLTALANIKLFYQTKYDYIRT